MSLFNKSKNNASDNVLEFYNDCVDDFHKTAKQQGFARNGMVFIPELLPIGETTVLSFLKDPFYSNEFSDSPQMYYYVIMSLSLQAGMVFAEKWHRDFAGLNSKYIAQIIAMGPAETCNPLLSSIGLTDSEKQNEFYRTIYKRWVAMHEPYWALKDPREYTFRATLAAYQLGISMILCEYGY